MVRGDVWAHPNWMRVFANGERLSASLSLAGRNSLRLTPLMNPLPTGVDITVILDATIEALDGTVLGTEISWSFTMTGSATTEIAHTSPIELPIHPNANIVGLQQPLRVASDELCAPYFAESSGVAAMSAFWNESNDTWTTAAGGVRGTPSDVSIAPDGAGGVAFQNTLGSVRHMDPALAPANASLGPPGLLMRMRNGPTISWSRNASAGGQAASFTLDNRTRIWLPNFASETFTTSSDDLIGVVPADFTNAQYLTWQPPLPNGDRQLFATKRTPSGAIINVPYYLGDFHPGSLFSVSVTRQIYAAIAVAEPGAGGFQLRIITYNGTNWHFRPALLAETGDASHLLLRTNAMCCLQSPSQAMIRMVRDSTGDWQRLPDITHPSGVSTPLVAASANRDYLFLALTNDSDLLAIGYHNGKDWSLPVSFRDRFGSASTIAAPIFTHAAVAPVRDHSFLVLFDQELGSTRRLYSSVLTVY